MPKQIRPATAADVQCIEDALDMLEEARDALKAAGAQRAVIAVNRALKSVQGARRHVENRYLVAQRGDLSDIGRAFGFGQN